MHVGIDESRKQEGIAVVDDDVPGQRGQFVEGAAEVDQPFGGDDQRTVGDVDER